MLFILFVTDVINSFNARKISEIKIKKCSHSDLTKMVSYNLARQRRLVGLLTARVGGLGVDRLGV